MKELWDIISMLLILFVCVTTPARIAFTDEDDNTWTIINIVIDTLFLIDLVLNFFSAYHDEELNLIDGRKEIALHYLKGWFLIDLISILPISFLTKSGDYNSLVRIARFPKLYRLIKITRLIRVLKVLKQKNKFIKYLKKVLKISAGLERLLFFLLFFLLICHIVSCLWIFSARLEDFSPETWVVRYGLQDSTDIELFLSSLYFTVTTITTVGFGDISGGTLEEKIICILLVLFGVISFSFATGTLSSILSNMDSSNAKLLQKLQILKEIKDEYKIGSKLYDKLRQALKYDHQRNEDDATHFMQELPEKLRMELACKIHQRTTRNIPFLNGRPKDFIAEIGSMLRPC